MESSKTKQHGLWRPQKYFAMRKPIGRALVLYVSAGLLTQRFRVKIKTVRNGISNSAQQRSSYWRSFRDKEAVMIDYDSIPANTKSKAKLPIDSKKAYEQLKADCQIQEDINEEAEILQFQRDLEDTYNNRWPKFLKFYTGKIADEFKRILHAKSHGLIDFLMTAVREKWPSKIIFETYRKFVLGEIDNHEQPHFKTTNPVYFWRVIRNCRTQGISPTLIHDSLGVAKEYLVKMTGVIKAFIRLQLRDPRNLLINEIIERVKKKYGVELSASSIKSFKKNNQDRNVLEYDSNGKIHSRQNGLPKIIRFLAEGPGEQYQGDFYKIQFYCFDKILRKVVRLWAFVVLDVFSKKVVGWALGEKPSGSLAKNGFKMAFLDHCFLCEEIIIDNDPVYNRPIFKRFIRRINNMGVITTKAYPNIPTWKAEIESFFAVFQKLHAAKPWYIGEDVQSKNVAGNPADEFVKQLYKKSSSMLSVPEMTTEFGKMIDEYNGMTNKRKKKISPVDLFGMYVSIRTIKWEKWMEPLLFWRAKTKKRIKDDGRIDLQFEGVDYCYQVTEAETLWTYKNSDVRMCYDPNDLSRIHVFERGTLKYIGEIELRMVMTRENKKEVLKNQKSILRAAQQYLKDKRNADEAEVNGISGTKALIETRDDKIIKQRMRREKHEHDVSRVPIHP